MMQRVQIEQFVSRFMGVVCVGFGISILVGGALRFPPPTYAPLLRFSNDQVWPYGIIFLAAGLLMMTPLWKAQLAGAVVSAVINSLFSALFLVAVVKYPDAGGTAWWAYFCFGMQSSALAALIWWHRVRGVMDDGM